MSKAPITLSPRSTRPLCAAAAAWLVAMPMCLGAPVGGDPVPGKNSANTARIEDSKPTVRFEMRRVADSPAEGWTEHALPSDDKNVYLSPDVELANADVLRAWYEAQGGEHAVGLFLTEEGALKLAKLSKSAIGERIAILIDGRIVSAPRIAAPITGGRALIHGNLTEEEARAVAEGITPR